jgi:starch synthase (maltosyl-transferring)
LREFGIPPESRTFLYVGRLDRQKGLPFLLEAWAPVAARYRGVHLLLVGEGPERGALETQIARLGLAASVHLSGWREEIPELLRAADCFVLPSLWEGMPNVVLEAMAAGLPVIATRVEGTAEVIQAGETGWLVAPGAPGALTAAMEQFLDDPIAARSMGERGQRRVRAEYTWEQMVRRYEWLYEGILRTRS